MNGSFRVHNSLVLSLYLDIFINFLDSRLQGEARIRMERMLFGDYNDDRKGDITSSAEFP